MELAKITSKGQITLPIAIRKTLGVKDGDKVAFIQQGDQIVVVNASLEALSKVQAAFEGVADELGLKTEEDVVKMVKEVQAGSDRGHF